MIIKQCFRAQVEVSGYDDEHNDQGFAFTPRDVTVTYVPDPDTGGWVLYSMWIGGPARRADGTEGKFSKSRYFRWDNTLGVFRDTAASSRPCPTWAESYALSTQPDNPVCLDPRLETS